MAAKILPRSAPATGTIPRYGQIFQGLARRAGFDVSDVALAPCGAAGAAELVATWCGRAADHARLHGLLTGTQRHFLRLAMARRGGGMVQQDLRRDRSPMSAFARVRGLDLFLDVKYCEQPLAISVQNGLEVSLDHRPGETFHGDREAFLAAGFDGWIFPAARNYTCSDYREGWATCRLPDGSFLHSRAGRSPFSSPTHDADFRQFMFAVFDFPPGAV
jgi:hypothetical protein